MYRLLDKYEEDAESDPVLREDIRNAGGIMYVGAYILRGFERYGLRLEYFSRGRHSKSLPAFVLRCETDPFSRHTYLSQHSFS